uniref:Contactin associated protein family member 5 n=1 Tax=Nothobranchius furzeri TaxID=105023 RepID=A0A8C6NSK7_NOTFU
PSGFRAGGWSPMVTDHDPWLQVDLREQMEVTAVATQGRYDSWDWVSSYLLLYSDTGRIWKQHRHEDGFVGNVNSETVVQNKLSHPLKTRFLRFVPLDWNPSGWMGLRVEVFGCSYKSYVADFDGRSSLLYRFNQKSMSTVKDVISLRFKSHQAEGVLLHGEGQRGDYITLELHRGKLDLYLNLDDSRSKFSSRRVPVTVGSLLDDQHWHSVHMERFNKQVNLTVDSHSQHFQTKGDGHSLEVDYELSFGGIPLPGKPGTFLRKNFNGCVENLYYNGINVIDLAKRRKPQIHSVGNVTFSCSPPQLVACTFLSSSSSFLSLPSAAPATGEFSVRFQFRTWNPEGLLLSVQLSPSPQKLELQISNSWLHLTLHSAGRQRSEVSAGRRVNDGLWHAVSLTCRNLRISLTVDGEPSSNVDLWEQVESKGSFYFGGCPPMDCHVHTPAFQGCMQLISINNQLLNLTHVQQGFLGSYNELQRFCLLSPRCLPNLCEHGARCSQTWSSFSCDCSGTGYSGATCHNSIYESSCETYKLSGSSSGFYFIDPDGSGPLGPTQVYCNMTENKVWTILSHNSTSPVRVPASSPQKPYNVKFSYNASADQLRAVISGSDQCQQEVVYTCKRSRLFNTKDGSPLSWWLDREGERRSYWGGFLPGVQQCSCSLEENCMDMNYFCNCDADRDTWANDTGILSYKDHLPVSQIFIGDTNRTGSEAVYHVGPLRCYGDRGTASQQRGFLGCIRSLTVNGRSVDLEERAKMTPGVTSGCPGYCSGSSSLCHNRGRCIEKNNGYICDCSQSAYGGTTCNQEVSVSFDRESSVTYTFQEPFSVMQNRSSQVSSVSKDSRAREDVAFSFVTSQRPSMLLTVSTFSQQYIAVILTRNGSLQIWYHLQTDRSPDVFGPALGNLADGRLHRIRMHRVGKNLYVQIDQDIHRKYTLSSDAELILIRYLTLGMENLDEEVMKAASKGFIGCLSSVQFNHVAPLKAALTNRGSSLISIRALTRGNVPASGHDCNSHHHPLTLPPAVFSGVVTAVVFIAVCALAVVSRLLYQQRQAQRNSSIKEEHRHSTYTDYRTELHLHNSVRDSVKEYYI